MVKGDGKSRNSGITIYFSMKDVWKLWGANHSAPHTFYKILSGSSETGKIYNQMLRRLIIYLLQQQIKISLWHPVKPLYP